MKAFFSVLILLFTLSGCTTYTINGAKTTSVSDLSAPRKYPHITFGIPNESWPRVFSSQKVKSAFENTQLFSTVEADGKNRGQFSKEGIYIQTSIKNSDSTNPGLAILSILTVGLIPMRIEYDYQVTSQVYLDGELAKTYHDEISTASLFAVLLPTPLLVGRSKDEMEKLFAARYVSNLLVKMNADGIAFKSI